MQIQLGKLTLNGEQEEVEWNNAHQTQPWHVVSRKINWGGPKKKECHNCNIIIVITLFLHSSAYDTTVFLSTFKWNELPLHLSLIHLLEVLKYIVWKEFSRDRDNPCTKHQKIYHTYYRTLFFYLQGEKKMPSKQKENAWSRNNIKAFRFLIISIWKGNL